MLDLRRLRILRELAHRGTLATVADALGYSPSTISQQLSQLESEAGLTLLEPAGRRVRLTPAAQILVRHAETLLANMEQAEAELAQLAPEPSPIRVAAFQSAALALFPAALTHLARTHPTLRVELTVLEPEQSLPALTAREVDLAITEEYPHRPLPRHRDIDRAALSTDELVLAAPSHWPATLAELAELPWVMEPNGTHAHDWALATCRQAGIEPDIRYSTTDLVLHTRLVEHGHAAALLPRLSGISASATTRITALPGEPRRQLYTAIRRGAHQHPSLTAIQHALATTISGPSAAGAAQSASQ